MTKTGMLLTANMFIMIGWVCGPIVLGVTLVNDNQNFQSNYKILNIADITGKINAPAEVLKVFNVKAYGAVGNGSADDTQAIRNAITDADAVGGVVYFQPGIYKITSTIQVTQGHGFGCRLEGANSGGDNIGVTILSTLAGTSPVFEFNGVSAWSNVGIKNMTIKAQTNYTGTGIKINGQVYAHFNNVQLVRMNYGVWLFNENPGSYSECNQFDEMNFEYCNNGVRMEVGNGDLSFHGNVFTSCYFNVDANQIGFNHVSGYYYNGRFQFFMWGHSTDAVYVNADGYAETNIGDITMENYGAVGKITGNGTFWYRGSMIVPGGVNDVTASSYGWKKVFVCDTYFKPIGYGVSNMTCYPLNTQLNAWDGPLGNIMSLQSYNNQSVLINCFQTWDDMDKNGLYLGRTELDKDENSGRLGMFVSASGAQIQSYCSSGLRLVTSDGNVALRVANGKVAIGDGTPIAKYLSSTLTWDPASLGNGAGTSVTITVTGAAVGDPVTVGHTGVVRDKLMLYGNVTSENTVTVTLYNQTGSSYNVSSGTLRVGVWKH